MKREEALTVAEQWVAEHRSDYRVSPESVFQNEHGWEIGCALPGERAAERWPAHGVEVHVLGTCAPIEDGKVVGRTWTAHHDQEFVWLPGMRLEPKFTAVTGYSADGEFRPNPAYVPGPLASGEPLPRTTMDRFLSYVARGWYEPDDLPHNGIHGEVLIPGEPPADYPETLQVYTRPELLPAGTTVWTRTRLNTFIVRVLGREFRGQKPRRMLINDYELDLTDLPDASAQHLRLCCGDYGIGQLEIERGPWLDQADISAVDRILNAPPSDAVAIRTVKVEFTLGVDDQGRKFVVKEAQPKADNGKLRGCLIGGAIGDALGANTENQPMEVVYDKHGPAGITDLPEFAAITDDTQMNLFTFEAVIRSHISERLTENANFSAITQNAYQRWLHTQKTPWAKARGILSTSDEPDGWLVTHRDLFKMRAPGLTCTSALQEFARTGRSSTMDEPVNNSKGCGGVMRVAPIAFWAPDAHRAFWLACQAAALTHGHPSGYLSAGVFAVLIFEALQGKGLREGVDTAMRFLVRKEGHEEVVAAIEHALELADLKDPSVARVEELGRGGVGETALAIALYAALVTDDPNEALLLSVNHGGDSDSTASMCGNLVGALHGVGELRPDWVERVQFREVIDQMIDDWATETGPNPPVSQEWLTRYPPI